MIPGLKHTDQKYHVVLVSIRGECAQLVPYGQTMFYNAVFRKSVIVFERNVEFGRNVIIFRDKR